MNPPEADGAPAWHVVSPLDAQIKSDTFFHERNLAARGFLPVAGCDEAGRGPLAGPVVSASVVLPPDCPWHIFTDSKKLPPKKREMLYHVLQEMDADIGVGSATHQEIDRINILQASLLAMKRSVLDLDSFPSFLLVDGTFPVPVDLPQKTLVRGELASASIAAASIIAKVTRDRLMAKLAQDFPVYGWRTNQGYGTAEHLAALQKYGVSPIHRKTFRPVRDIITPPAEQLELGL